MHIYKGKVAKTFFQVIPHSKIRSHCHYLMVPIFSTVNKFCITKEPLFLEPHCQKLAIQEDLITWHMWLLENYLK